MTNESRRACSPPNESRQETTVTEEEAPGAASSLLEASIRELTMSVT